MRKAFDPALVATVIIGVLSFFKTPSLIAENLADRIPTVILAWNASATGADSVDQNSFDSALRVLGLQPVHVPTSSLDTISLRPGSILVVPSASARHLRTRATSNVLRNLSHGANLILDGKSSLTNALGFRWGATRNISRLHDRFRPDVELRWSDKPSVPCISRYSPATTSVLVASEPDSIPLVLLTHKGRGRCLTFVPLFDPVSGDGYSRFPTFPDLVDQALDLHSPFTRNCIEVYFDPGYRGRETPEELADLWRLRGIRTVHIAAWYNRTTPPYQYARLLSALHSRGMLGYAWLQWPYIGREFWDRFPEWREKNALLQDAHIDFLYLMDLQNPECLHEATRELASLLEQDWDGVDLAEFSITGGVAEALEGPAQPAFFTGFSDVSRSAFRSLRGFDPIELFDSTSHHFWRQDSIGLDAFYDFRMGVSSRLLGTIMQMLDSLNSTGNRGWNLTLTILDNVPHPETFKLLATDQASDLSLVRHFGFTLQVEDLASEWTRPPNRYSEMGSRYRKIVGAIPFAIDINVVPVHPSDQYGFATDQPVGLELAHQWKAAESMTPQVCFYCESSIFDADWEFLPKTFASEATTSSLGNTLRVTTPHTIRLAIPQIAGTVVIDGTPWLATGPGFVIIPSGDHRVTISSHRFDAIEIPRLLNISHDLLNCSAQGDTLVVEYAATSRCAVTFSENLSETFVDGVRLTLPQFHGVEGQVLLAPRGTHRISVMAKQHR